jgi:hypothetical protein
MGTRPRSWNALMSFPRPQFWKICLLGVSIACAGADPVSAGWMGFRNDTKETIVIQESVTVNGKPKPGRPQRLFAGEAVRDAQSTGGQRTFSVYDPKNPNQPIYTGNFPCPAANENILYSLKSDGKGGINVEALKGAAALGSGPKSNSTPPKK